MLKNKLKEKLPFLVNGYHYIWSFFSAFINFFPSKKIIVIGITGTNGKSTTAKIVSSILKESGKKVALISSIDFQIGDDVEENKMKMTMPGRGFIQKFIREAVKKKCDVVVLEVTSEGIKQFRDRFIDFDVAMWTNLSPEHIEAHGGFENYKNSKGGFFKRTKKIHILNADDPFFDYFNSFSAQKKYYYSIIDKVEKNNHFIATDIKSNNKSIYFKCKNKEFELNLVGKFNVYNSLAAICLADYFKIPFEKIKKGLEKVELIPGRMEQIISDPFNLFIDYAFTPNALEKVYFELKEKYKPNKLIVVLGACGGGRDKWKRPVLGKIAYKYADEIIVTNEDPYDENPEKIIEDVIAGTNGKGIKILDRREAISHAIRIAKKNDLIIITGKGSESAIQIKNSQKLPWDEKKVILEEFEKIKK